MLIPLHFFRDRDYLHTTVKETIEAAAKNETFDELILPVIPKIIAKIPKPDKQSVIQNQKSRFGMMKSK